MAAGAQPELGTSRIAGKGLFARAPVAAGAVVLEQDGVGTLNHSCDPNLGWAGERTLVALRDIAAGDELTVDYATMTVAPWEMDCRCGSAGCRGVVTGDDWRRPDLQERYAGRFSPFINARIAQ